MSPPVSPIAQPLGVARLPSLCPSDSFIEVVRALSIYFVDELTLPSTFEQLRTTSAGSTIRVLVDYLVMNCHNPALINALLTLKWHFNTIEHDDRGINETRANACEIVAWRFLYRISERDAVNYCLYEIPAPDNPRVAYSESEISENSSFLPQFQDRDTNMPRSSRCRRVKLLRTASIIGIPDLDIPRYEDEDPTSSFTGLNGLEIAAIADCKKFLSQRVVQKIISGIWKGDITFWESLNYKTRKKPQFHNPKYHSDLFARLRVPRYIKSFEVIFFATFLFLYYAVLMERNPSHVTFLEFLLYIWLLAFTYDELGGFIDAGSIFYAVDIWNGCDLIIIIIGATFVFTRIIGVFQNSASITNWAFDILSLEALFMVPRLFSLLSLHPYFGTLIPCLKKMAKDFVKFMVVVAIFYVGFLTTFTLLARDRFNLSKMSWILIQVFFGSSYLGFDIMNDINPTLGPPLMLIFVCMTNILLITSLISILSDSFSKVIAHAREEYLFVYSVYVLEAASSNRLTHFYPPLNLIPLFLVRPIRIFLPAEKLRSTRIFFLKVTHLPFVGAIWLFERMCYQTKVPGSSFSSIGAGKVPETQNARDLEPRHQHCFSENRTYGKPEGLRYAQILKNDCSVIPKEDIQKHRASRSKKLQNVASNRELQEQVRGLSQKIEELTALIMAQQGCEEPE